jgi:hypothetical protein
MRAQVPWPSPSGSVQAVSIRGSRQSASAAQQLRYAGPLAQREDAPTPKQRYSRQGSESSGVQP